MSFHSTPTSGRPRGKAAEGLNKRFHAAAGIRRHSNKVFPTHWSQMLAGIAMSSLLTLIVSGLYLALFFDPSMTDVTYDGPFDNLHGIEVTRSFASALAISFEVRGGLFVRQVHHWAASLFLAAVLASVVAMLFTGAFRRPRRTIWALDVLLLLVGVFAAFTGVLLLGDLLSGTSLRMISGYLLSIPVAGTWLHWMLFGAEFPGTEIVPRLYLVHLLLPGIMVSLVALRTVLAGRHGHPQFRGRGRTERNVVGVRMLPGFVARAAALFAVTVGLLAVMGGLFQVNPVWAYGPANAAHVSAGSTPPWYFGWIDGAVRLWPAWDIHLGDYTIPSAFWPSMVLLPVSFAALACYPWLERRVTGDDGRHHLLQRPRDVPRRTSVGMAMATFYGCLQLAATIDVIAFHLHLSADALLWAGRIGVLVLPPLAYAVTHRICQGLQHDDRAVLADGVPTGIITRHPHGGYLEPHQPLDATYPDKHPARPPVPKTVNQIGATRAAVSGSPLRPDADEGTTRLRRAHDHDNADRRPRSPSSRSGELLRRFR